MKAKHILLAVPALLMTLSSLAEEDRPRRNIDGIADNSFFVEEAYNQEKGVVQHMFKTLFELPDHSHSEVRDWQFALTQEWPLFSQRHQLSYTIPFHIVEDGSQSSEGLGDVILDYRLQVYFDHESLTAFAPRVSLILPTGDADKGFGEDTVGYQLNLPFSTTFGDSWYAHLNSGTTFLPSAASGGNQDLWNYNLGASLIYAATPDLHLLVEWIGNWDESMSPSGNLRYEFSSAVIPGIRHALNFKKGSQLVLGLGVPIGLNASTADIGGFLYLSFEHAFRRLE